MAAPSQRFYAAPAPRSSHGSVKSSKTKSTAPLQVIEQCSTLASGERVVVRRFEKGKLLGKGGFAKCYRFKDIQSGKLYAGKIISKEALVKAKAKVKLQIEIKLHKNLCHKRIVRLRTWFEDTHNAYIILELCPNLCMSQLVKRRKRLTEFEARFYMIQILEGVSHLHQQQIIHRDLKLGNIFLDANMDIKLGDFGLAAKLDFPGDRKKTICGTPNYIAPEILEGKHGHGPPVDIWSIGVILYTFIIGRPPYETQDVKATYRRIRKNQYSFPPDVEISLQARTMIGRILQLLPEQRPSLEQMRADAYLTQNAVPRSIPQMAVSACPTFGPADLCAPEVLPARRPLEPRQTNTQQYSSDQRLLKGERTGAPACSAAAPSKSKSSTAYVPAPSISAAASGGPHPRAAGSAGVDVKPAHPKTARERRAPQMAGAAPPLALPASAREPRDACDMHPTSQPPSQQQRQQPEHHEVQAVTKAFEGMQVGAVAASAKVAAPDEKAPDGKVPDARWATAPKETAAAPASSTPAAVAAPAPAMRTEQQQPMAGTLETMHRQLAMSFAAQESGTPQTTVLASAATDPSKLASEAPKLWVTKWVDYTSKYGLGYLLSDGSSGVYFNDSTKIIVATNNANFEYLERTKRGHDHMGAVEAPRAAHLLEQFPSELQKKVTLLKHFRNYLIEQQAKAGVTLRPVASDDPMKEMVYLKKWVRTRHAILFRLSNRTVQVCFFDQTELMLSSHARVVS